MRSTEAVPTDKRRQAPVATPSGATRVGTVIEQFSSQPLGGVAVRWIVRDGKRRDSQQELGRATSADDGLFTIVLADDAEAQAAFRELDCAHGGDTFLVADGVKAVPDPGAGAQATLVFATKKSSAPTREQWAGLADVLMAQRALGHDALVRTLSAAPRTGSGLSVATRAAALAAVHAALGEGNGSRDVVLDFESLAQGRLVRALNPRDGILAGGFDAIGQIVPRLPRSDRALYRDYLRSVWVDAATRMWESWNIGGGTPSPAALEAQLDSRFHQDFHTEDTAAVPAAKLLIPILVSILVADAAREGFGIPAATIPKQGAASDDDYLATLVALSGEKPQELRNRFRIAFVRRPNEQTTAVDLNVEALLGLLRDTYQSDIEPFPALPAIEGNGQPIVFDGFLGRAPFFLEYEEWLERQRVFFPENAYDIRAAVPVYDKQFRFWITPDWSPSSNGLFADKAERTQSIGWLAKLPPTRDTLDKVFAALDVQDYNEAGRQLDAAWLALNDAVLEYEPAWVRSSFAYTYSNGVVVHEPVSLAQRATSTADDLGKLAQFEAFLQQPGPTEEYPDPEYVDEWVAVARAKEFWGAVWTKDVFIPYMRARIAFTQGDCAEALHQLGPLTGYPVGIGAPTDTSAYDMSSFSAELWMQSSLPYTVKIPYDDNHEVTQPDPVVPDPTLSYVTDTKVAIAPFEQRFFQLFQGTVMLALADTLYRSDTPDQIARARELYKGVLFLHGEDPGISPHFSPNVLQLPNAGPFWRFFDNPAKVSQVERARLALFQIEQGLNAYGYADDVAPILRYKPLKHAADVFAQGAKDAQNDYLNYLTRLEQAQIELWQTQALVKKADASARIANEQIEIAKDGVTKAQAQVTAVEQQIAAKEAEIADKNSLFSQFSDYLSGVKDSLEGMVPLAEKVVAGDSAAAGGSVSLGDLAGIASKTSSGGAAAGEDAAAAALGSGAAFLVGYGAFAYTSYQSMSAMADAANKRSADLSTLQNAALPAAKAQVVLRQRDVTIAQQQLTIAQADLEYGQQLLRFEQDRFLNIELWNRLSLFANDLMRRYLDLGASTAWFAERALAFEQDREIRIIKLDYWPTALRGLTGADSLLFDLAQLEANRLQGVRLTAPVKHTVSLARDFPLAFGQLKKTGMCRFATDEAELRALYPGTYGYRIRALTVAADNPDGAPPRGILRNGGISHVGAEDGTSTPLARFPDALPLSEFRLRDDLFVFGLPGETLLQFEGSGYSTSWELELPLGANLQGLRAVADVLISFDMNAGWSASAAAAPAIAAAGAAMVAASVFDPAGLKALRDPAKAKAKLLIDPRRLQLPLTAAKRTLTNIAVLIVGFDGGPVGLRINAQSTGEQASVTMQGGIATSNAGELLGAAAASPLNALAGADLEQPFVLEFDKKAEATDLARSLDVVCRLEYDPPL